MSVQQASPQSSSASAVDRTRSVRIGAVSFMNTLPLIDGLGGLQDVELSFSVPSRLQEHLLEGKVDVALCSSIDYQTTATPLSILPVGVLGCAGPTLTVRLYSAVPLEQITSVYCDTDSHTSVVLMRILLQEMYGLEPTLVPYHAREHVANHRPVEWPEAMLLIGDKVVTDSPPAVRYPHQLDLGAAWSEHTGLPFVFAAWMARADAPAPLLRLAAAVLDRQRRRNAHRLDTIIHHRVEPRGWPGDLARRYLGELLQFAPTESLWDGLRCFHEKAAAHGLIEQCRPLDMFRG